MNGGSTESALDRIESAIARIERAASLPMQADADLRARHETLKSSVSDALARIDALIGAQGE